MRKVLLICISLLSASAAFSQVSFERLFSKESTDVFRCIQEVPSGGGYILAGYTADSTANDSDAFVVRLNNLGDTIWTYTFNGPLSKKDLFYKIINTSDGGFVACGYSTSFSGISDDVLFVKLNASGKEQWTKSFGGSGKERGQDIVETSDGYTIAGYTTTAPAQYYDALIIHINKNGDTVWTKIIGGSDYDDANSLKQLPDGGYILGGQSANGSAGFQPFLIRTDVSGDTLWTKHLSADNGVNIECIALANDGFVFAGNSNTVNTGDDGYLVKTDFSGNVLWAKSYGGSLPDDFHRVETTSDGGLIASGTSSSTMPPDHDPSLPATPNMWLMRTNGTGDSLWSKVYGRDNHDHGYSGLQTSDGGYIIAGHSGSFGFRNEDGYIVKVVADGTGTNHLEYITAYELITPTCSGVASQVKVSVRNFGNVPVSNIPVTVEVSGGITQILHATIAGPLVPGDVTIVTFSPTINTSVGGSFTFYGHADVANTVYPANNSFTKTSILTACTGIEELETQLGFSIYPNPANENIIVDFSDNYSNAKIELINITGEVVNSISVLSTHGFKKSIDLSGLSKGFYLLKVTTEKGFDVRKIILE